jgi:glucose/arabinose dehydrogenase
MAIRPWRLRAESEALDANASTHLHFRRTAVGVAATVTIMMSVGPNNFALAASKAAPDSCEKSGVPSAAKASTNPDTASGSAPTSFVKCRHYRLGAANLPLPEKTGDMEPERTSRDFDDVPRAPRGFRVTQFASDIGNARWLTVAPNGDVFVSASGDGKIMLLRDVDGTKTARFVSTYASGYMRPHGLAFHNGALYIADLRGIWRQPYKDGDNEATGAPTKITAGPDLRINGWHWTREIVFDHKGQLYLAMGARKDIEDNDPPPDATIQLVHADGKMTTFASGLRNVVGMAICPQTGELWGTVNERDQLGPNLPPDFLTSIHSGDFLGWPYAYIGPHADPMFGKERPDLVAKTKTPEVLFEAHSAPLAIVFYQGSQFPPEYNGDAFVAFHASGPLGAPDGYKVVRVPFAHGHPLGGYQDFLTGWTKPGTNPPQIWGTPSGLAVAKDGALLVADESSVWRVSFVGQ